MADSRAAAFTLGSASPRRAALLAPLGIAFDIDTVDIDEAALVDTDLDPTEIVAQIAAAKFAAFPVEPDVKRRPLLTADTLVACGDALLGKPMSHDDLVDMLELMSGQTLAIASAVCVGERGAAPATETVLTEVDLRALHPADIDTYVASGEGMDKAAGLALQGAAGAFITEVRGCWSNVLGLPVCVATQMLHRTLGADVSNEALAAAGHAHCSIEWCGRRDG